MKFNPCVVNPTQRSDQVSDWARRMGVVDPADIRVMRMIMTPVPLHVLPDHCLRGHKSLGRIQQLMNRRRFKVRASTSR